MNISKLLLGTMVTIILFIFTMSSFGQSKNNKEYKDCTPEEKASIISDNLKPVLNLSDEQYTKIYNVYLDRIRWKSVNEVAGMQNKSLRRKKFEEFKYKLKTILSQEQQESFKKYCESKKKYD
ncbi:MAG: hypothetical protein NTU73_08590 [Ignavibacteriae bacterium]|nr:hypothetical protein [Ignavibacteriota bacterium]